MLITAIGLGVCEATGITHLTGLRETIDRPAPLPDVSQRSTEIEPNPAQLIVAVDEKKDVEEQKAPAVYPVALLAFEDRGTKDAAKVVDLLFAKLSANDALYLVDRVDLKKVLAEAELNISGAVKSGEATKVGQLTGAKLLITGSVILVEKKITLVAKLIGTETSRVFGVSVEGKVNDDLTTLVDQLAVKLGEKITEKAADLVAKAVPEKDRIATLKGKLKKFTQRPSVFIQVGERHVGLARIDPAAQTELTLFCKETGFTVMDDEDGMKSKADYIIKGEGISETAARNGNLVSVKSRVEVKVVERKTGKVVVVDRQTVVIVDLTEQIAGKSGLQEAAAQIAERLLPKLPKE